MKSQQAAEREEQLRIKNLVLNYDLREESEQHDGEPYGFLNSSSLPPLTENPNTKGLSLGSERFSASHSRSGQGSGRNSHRARKLQLSDVDWYGNEQLGTMGGRAGNLYPGSKLNPKSVRGSRS
jgi:regulator of nonsense transcripts 2